MSTRVKITKINQGHRVTEYVDIVPTFGVTFSATPDTVVFTIAGSTYTNNQTASFENGSYTYVALVPGNSEYAPVTGSFNVRGGEVEVHEDLSLSQYSIIFSSIDSILASVDSVEISANNKVIGTTNSSGVLVAKLIAGKYNITGRKNGFTDYIGTLTVTGATSLSVLMVAITPQTTTSGGAPVPGAGVVAFSGKPTGANIAINGANEGNLPFSTSKPVDSYTYVASAPGYASQSGSFRTQQDIVAQVTINLLKIETFGTINFSSNQASVEVVRLDTYQSIGYTPMSANFNSGTYNFVARKPGFSDTTFTLTVQPGGNLNYYINMNALLNYPAAGTIVSYFCSSYDRMVTKNDGYGGTYNELVEKNSAFCDYPTKGQVIISDNAVNSTIIILDANKNQIDAIFKTSPSVTTYLPVGQYTAKSVPNSTSYDTVEKTFEINNPTLTTTVELRNRQWTKKVERLILNFELREGSASPFGTTKGIVNIKCINGVVNATLSVTSKIDGNKFSSSLTLYAGGYNVGTSSLVNSFGPLFLSYVASINQTTRNATLDLSSAYKNIDYISGSSKATDNGTLEYGWQVEYYAFKGDGQMKGTLAVDYTYEVLS